MKSALFVDFDNIYSGLRQLDHATADRFAKAPTEWVSWMINSLALPEHVAGDARRRILVRRCYLNPQVYQRFRPYFNLAGFEITDCPALTSGGKTSTDIHMVLDIIDLLQHETHYDEFIVLSADADFTPVLRKLRRWDRRTTVLAIGFPSAAYRASADLVIDQDEFLRGALGAAKPHDVDLRKRASNASSLTVAPGSSRTGSAAYEEANSAATIEIADQSRASPSAEAQVLAELVRREVQRSTEPVACARLAQSITRHAGATPSDWYGNGSFRRFLESLDLTPLQFDWKVAGGIIFDPERHARAADATNTNQEWTGDASILAFARQLHEVAGVPLLAPPHYKELFTLLSADLDEHGYRFLETAKRVRDRCRETGLPVNRADIDFILRGLVFRGHQFDGHANTAAELSAKFANNVRSLCLREQIVLDAQTEALIRHWIGPSDTL